MAGEKRIDYLDGLRGVAIIAVVLFHAYICYPDTLPFGERFGALPLRLGWQGVQLFFLISGFVILMTLERCERIAQFASRRWLRLFPAMLIASLLTYMFMRLFVPTSTRTLSDFLPGLTFISPALIHSITGLQIQSMDVAYWSLYVEVVFYAVFGISYFLFGDRIAIAIVFGLFAATVCATALTSGLPTNSPGFRISAAMQWIGLIHFGWFASGSLFYLFAKTRSRVFLVLAVTTGVICALTHHQPLTEKAGLLCMVGVFLAAITLPIAQIILSSRPLVFIGSISYPLYLIHSQVVVTMQWAIAKAFPAVHPAFWPLVPILLTVLIAWAIARVGEPGLRTFLKSRQTQTATAS